MKKGTRKTLLMFLHLGQDTVVNTKNIIGLFDLDTTTIARDTRDYLAKAEKDGHVVNVSTELPKSFVVTAGADEGVYISQLSAITLKKRYDVQINSKQMTD